MVLGNPTIMTYFFQKGRKEKTEKQEGEQDRKMVVYFEKTLQPEVHERVREVS